MQEKNGVVRSFIQEVLESQMVVKIFGVEPLMVGKAQDLQQEYYQAKIKKNRISILANSGFSLIFAIGYLFALIWFSFGLLNKTITFGTLTAVLQLVSQVQTPFSTMSGLLPKAYDVLASAERMKELENLPDEPELNQTNLDLTTIYSNMHSLAFEGVTFRYDRDIVLSCVDLKIQKGDFAVMSGISGIGKSCVCCVQQNHPHRKHQR
ncbi:MAG: ABC transporter transmembrane domain-containing protein [Bacillota bacterium]|nr:ABC transporter transmembrane domain-containing protein [Bacillota bacterium]